MPITSPVDFKLHHYPNFIGVDPDSVDDAAECAAARSQSAWGHGATDILCVRHAVHIDLGGCAPRDQQLEVAPRPVCLHDRYRLLLRSFGQPSPVKVSQIIVMYSLKGLRIPMIRFVQLISTPLAKAAWLRTDLLRCQLLASICLVAAQQPEPVKQAVLILREIAWLQVAPIPSGMACQESCWGLACFLQRCQDTWSRYDLPKWK